MNVFELKQVIAKVQLGDNRQADELIIREWGDTIGMLDFQDSIAAVTMHRQESTAYLQPAHIVANVKRIVKDRYEAQHHLELQTKERGHPKPANYDAMTAAWNNPAALEREVAIYHDQLRAAGHQIADDADWKTNYCVHEYRRGTCPSCDRRGL